VTIVNGSRIAGLGHYAPPNRIENAEIEARLGLETGWIERRTGIRARRWASADQATSDLAVFAGANAIEDSGVAPNEIALTLLATSTPDHLLPPSAPLVAHRLRLTNSGAVDMAGACAGFIYALVFADGFVRTQGQPVLVVAANVLSRRINPNQRASSVIFGDAAGAVVLVPTRGPENGVLGVSLASNGGHYGLISIAAGGSRQGGSKSGCASEDTISIVDGQEVFIQAVQMMSECASRALAAAHLSASQIDRFLPHQANVRIFDLVARRLGLPMQSTIRTITEYGNSSAATIPLSMSLANQACRFRSGEHLLLAAAGAGMTGGAVVHRF